MEYSSKGEEPSSTTTNKKTAKESTLIRISPQVNDEQGKPDAAPESPPTVASTSDTPEYLV